MIHNIQWSILKEIWTQNVTLCNFRSVNFPSNRHCYDCITWHVFLFPFIRSFLWSNFIVTCCCQYGCINRELSPPTFIIGPLNIVDPKKYIEIVLLDCTSYNQKEKFLSFTLPDWSLLTHDNFTWFKRQKI